MDLEVDMTEDDLCCPRCGALAESTFGAEEDGYFADGVLILRCQWCGALVQDSQFITVRESLRNFDA
jgi:uncharacterized C2H2 Zn-finger protein